MKTVVVEIPDSKAYLIPIGDTHIGDKGFTDESKRKLKGYIKWIKDRDNARAFLMGDIVNLATPVSKSSVFEQNMNLKEQLAFATELFSPIKDKIVGGISGNHEQRLSLYSGMTATAILCERLGVEDCNYSAILDFKVGKKARGSKVSNRIQYTSYMHHTTGGGKTPGSKVNRVSLLSDVVQNADFYCGAHNHSLFAVYDSSPFDYNPQNRRTNQKDPLLVGCGGYLQWADNYPEMKMLSPVKIGSPRVRMDGLKKDVHVNI